MAIEAISTDLDIAKQARSAAREKMANHIGSPNLNRSGTQKSLVAPTPQIRPKSAAALKREYGNGREKSVKQVEREVVGNSILLRGKVRAIATAQGNVAQNKQAIKLSPTFTVPMTSSSRATNKDGATSFHFKHEAIAKTMREKTSASGTKTRKNAGREHSKYLERDSAVARNGEAIDCIRPPGERKDAADALGRAAAGGLYIEREEALAHQENGVAVIYSNISQNADERHRFWHKIEEYEVEPKPDQLVFVTGRDPGFWEAVRTDLRCPKQLALAIQEADPSKPCRIRTDDNEFIRQIMADYGWAPPLPRKPDESATEKAERKRLDQVNSKGAHCVDGRGGRIQNRIVGELPYEVSHEQRIRILRRFAAHFEGKKLPYVAVMHAPDHTNHEKNWHFHLAYYDRPCGRFTGKEADYLPEPQANWRAQAMHKRKVEAFASGALQAYVGQWDFTVPMNYKTNCSHERVSYPFAQDKDRACTKSGYPWELRKKLAEFTNDELQLAGSGRRVDPRRFPEMGINKEGDEHLGTGSAQMECFGIATPKGVENEHRQWHFTLDGIENNFKADELKRMSEERRWRQLLECYDLNPSDHSAVSKMITRWAETQAEANEQAAIATELAHQYERAESRAKKVQETCKRHLTAIDGGRANKRQRDNQTNYEARLTDATEHLSGLTIVMASEIVQEKRSRDEATRLTKEADNIRAEINARLKEELSAIVAAPVFAKSKVKEKLGPSPNAVSAADILDDKVVVGPGPNHSQSHIPLRQSDVEHFMKHLVDNNRRLVREGNYLVPFNPDDYEKHIIGAPNYADHQKRLLRLKAVQDAHIDRLSDYIFDNPNMIKCVQGEAGARAARYELTSDDRLLQSTFAGFCNDKAIKAALEKALKAQQNGEIDVAPPAPSIDADRATGASPAPVGAPARRKPAVDMPAESKAKPSTLTAVMRKIDELAAATRPIICKVNEGRVFYSLAEQDMRDRGLVNQDLRAEPVQTRLKGISQQQDSEINRLVGFVRRSPARVITIPSLLLRNNQPVVGLARTAPPDLLALSQKYANHPVAQEQMSFALRHAAAEPARTNAVEPKPVAGATEQRHAEPESASGEGSEVERQNAGSSAPALTRPDPAPSDGLNLTKPKKVRAQPNGREPTGDQTGKQSATSSSTISAENVKATEAVRDRFGKTRQQRDELLRRWTGEDDGPSKFLERQVKRDRLDRSKEKQDAAPVAHVEPVHGQAVSARLDSLEKRLIRLVEDDGYIVPAYLKEEVAEEDAELIRDHQTECRAIKERQDKQVAEISHFLFDHTDKLAACPPVEYPAPVQMVITAWPRDPLIAAHFELIEVNSNIIRSEASMGQRQYELMYQASQIQR